jgi:hypothetical protein
VPPADQVGGEHIDDRVVTRRIRRDAVDGSEVLLDVHGQSIPPVAILGVCPESHRGRDGRVEAVGDDGHRGAVVDRQRRDGSELFGVARDNYDPAQQRLFTHLRSLQVPA